MFAASLRTMRVAVSLGDMRVLLAAVALSVGCGGSVDASDEPCRLPTAEWTWEFMSGNCGPVPPVSKCDATDAFATTARGVCEVSGDLRCGADTVTVACESGVCYAAVTAATCSGEYTLRVR